MDFSALSWLDPNDTGGIAWLGRGQPGVAESLEVQRDGFAHEALDLVARIADNGDTGQVWRVRPPGAVAALVDDEVLGHRRPSSPVL